MAMKEYVKIKSHKWWSLRDRKNAKLLSQIDNWMLQKPEIRNFLMTRLVTGEKITKSDINELLRELQWR